MKETNTCPNCGEALKGGLKSNSLLPKKEIDFINFMTNSEKDAYCKKCGQLSELKKQHKVELEKHYSFLKKNIKQVPIVTTHSPCGWDYDSLSIVTGQSVIGTGVVSEFKSDLTDMFGGQSGSFTKKLAEGEKICFAQIRSKTLIKGGNAIIATNIDYGEAGAAKGMLMVCAAGTAVKIKNAEVLGEKKDIIEELAEIQERVRLMEKEMKTLMAF